MNKVILLIILGLLSACGGGGSQPNEREQEQSYLIGGSVTGLVGSVTLTNNGQNSLQLNGDGQFNFTNSMVGQSGYNVEVSVQPEHQVCSILNGSGTVANSNISDIEVTCVDILAELNGFAQDYFTGDFIPNAFIAFSQGDDVIASGITNADGRYLIEYPKRISGRVIISGKADNYAHHSIVTQLTENRLLNDINIPLMAIQSSQIISGDLDSDLMVGGQTIATILSGSLVRADGTAVNGDVRSEILVLDPSGDPNVLPGDYLSIDIVTGNNLHIESFGAVDIILYDIDENELQLGLGQLMEIRIPIADSTNPNNLPPTTALFYFDSISGYWIEDGVAILTEISLGVWAYVGSIDRLGIWSAGAVYETTIIHGCVELMDGSKVENAQIFVQGQDYIGSSTTLTDLNGNFDVTVKANSNVLIKAHFNGSSNTLQANTGVGAGLTLPACLVVGDAAISITLTWGESPSDLDSHFYGPQVDGTEFHIYFGNKSVIVDGVEIFLDVDDTTSFGPEVITVPNLPLMGTYRYVVHNYSGSPEISSPARVELNVGGNIYIFSPPVGVAEDYWHVFNIEYNNGSVQVLRTQNWSANSSGVSYTQSSTKEPNPYQSLKNKKYYSQ